MTKDQMRKKGGKSTGDPSRRKGDGRISPFPMRPGAGENAGMRTENGAGGRLGDALRPSQDALKLTACAAMLLDHIGGGILEILLSEGIPNPELALWLSDIDLILRMLGRVSFPLFAYLLVQGVLHTGSLPRYALRLFVFALISELPFDLLFFQRPTGLHQNIFWTLLLGVLTLWAVRSLANVSRPFSVLPLPRILAAAAIMGAAMGAAVLLHTDYSWKGILLIALIYFLRENRPAQCMLTPALYLGAEYLSLLLGGYTADYALSVFFQHVTICLSFVLIFFSVPVRRKRHRYAFYAFYPVHLSLLYLLRRVFFA